MVYKLASYVRGHLFGVLSALVVAVNPIFLRYAFEARNYTMFAFAATGSAFFLLELSKKFTWQRALGFVIFSTLGIYTHYYMFFVLAAQGLYLILFDRQILLKMVGLYAICAILYLPWLPFLFGQLKSVGQSYWIGAIDVRTHYEALLRILGGENQNPIRPLLFGLSIILLIVGLGRHALRHKFEKPYLLIWLWAIVPFVLATLPGLKVDGIHFPFRPIFFWRYLIGSSVPLSMVIVHAAQSLKEPYFKLIICVIVILSLLIDLSTFFSSPYSFREVYQQKVLPTIQPGDRIVTVLPSFAEVLYYRNQNKLENEFVVLNESLVQFSGKSLLDTYAANGALKVENVASGHYFEMRPGQKIVYK